MTHIKHLDHIAIATKNLTESLDFFEKKLGLICTHIEDIPERGLRVAMIPIGDTRIELIEALREDSEISTFLKKNGPGIHHLAFATNNIYNDMKMLQEQKIALINKKPTPGAHGAQVGFIHPKSSGGLLVELCQHKN
jgi:methylmalonyl-CoA/ethylmalonyl-CoA epimerase